MQGAVVVADIILVQLAVVTVEEHLLQLAEEVMVQTKAPLVLQDPLTPAAVEVVEAMVVVVQAKQVAPV
jgi:hypothetical protein